MGVDGRGQDAEAVEDGGYEGGVLGACWGGDFGADGAGGGAVCFEDFLGVDIWSEG